MLRNKAFKFRLYPNKEQEEYFSKCFGCCRFIWNKMLEDKINYYQANHKSLNNTPAQYKKEFEWLKEIDAYALANVQINLQKAFNSFFKSSKFGYPKWKSKKNHHQSYTTNCQSNNIKIENGYICLPKIKWVKIKLHRQIPNNYIIKSVTISKSPSDKYYASILTEYEYEVPQPKLNPDTSIGLDYSSHNFYTDSQGVNANYPKYYREMEKKLAKEQRKLSKMIKGSHNYKKQRIKVAKIHEKIHNQRLDFIHKLSTQLANSYDYIFVEDLNMQGISQSLKLGKSTMDNGFGMFRNLLQYKMDDRGKILHKINKFTPTSQICHCCGCKSSITKDLSIRSWICPECGAELDRDINAAINIKTAGLAELNLL